MLELYINVLNITVEDNTFEDICTRWNYFFFRIFEDWHCRISIADIFQTKKRRKRQIFEEDYQVIILKSWWIIYLNLVFVDSNKLYCRWIWYLDWWLWWVWWHWTSKIWHKNKNKFQEIWSSECWKWCDWYHFRNNRQSSTQCLLWSSDNPQLKVFSKKFTWNMEVYYLFVARILSEIYSDTTLNISKLPQQKKFYLQSIPCRRVLGMATTQTTPIF